MYTSVTFVGISRACKGPKALQVYKKKCCALLFHLSSLCRDKHVSCIYELNPCILHRSVRVQDAATSVNMYSEFLGRVGPSCLVIAAWEVLGRYTPRMFVHFAVLWALCSAGPPENSQDNVLRDHAGLLHVSIH
jgi:hypothetical protein